MTDVVFFKDEDMFHFTAYIKAPEDSVYRHKVVKLEFEIPSNYPLVPPIVKYIQHGGERIHPNLYVEGKVCLSILGTWPGEPWAFGMKCNSVLITIRSLLDNSPYVHEPHQRDDRAFNEYVRYCTWKWLLLDYIENETNPAAKDWLRRHVRRNGREMLLELRRQQRAWEGGGEGVPNSRVDRDRALHTPYRRLHPVMPHYDRLCEMMEKMWTSTLADESLGGGGSDGTGGATDSGIGGGSGSITTDDPNIKRKIDVVDLVEDPLGEQKKKKPEEKSTTGTADSHKPPPPLLPPPSSEEEHTERAKKRAKGEPEVVDLT